MVPAAKHLDVAFADHLLDIFRQLSYDGLDFNIRVRYPDGLQFIQIKIKILRKRSKAALRQLIRI